MPPDGRRRLPPALLKAVLALGVTLAVFGVSRFRGGPIGDASPGDPDDRALVRANLAETLGLLLSQAVSPDVVEWADAPGNDEAPSALGAPIIVWCVAQPPGEAAVDVFRVPMRLGRTGIPVAVGAAVNVSRTPHGDERLLAWAPERAVWGVGLDGHLTTLTYVDLGVDTTPPELGFATRALARVAARQAWGLPRSPRRLDVQLVEPTRGVTATLLPEGATLALSPETTLTLNAKTGALEPAGWGRVQTGSADSGEWLSLLADTLRHSALVGTARVVALEASLFQLRDWIERARHALFPTAADREPVGASVDVPSAHLDQWPPPPLPVPGTVPGSEAFEGEGAWASPVPERPTVLRTFLRVDPARPYERVYLFAFDMRALALRFVAGTRDPRSTTGVRGTGRIVEEDKPGLVAAFNGGFKIEHGAFGTVESRGVVIPPTPGWATVAVDTDGRARFGVWDVDGALPESVFSLRQNLPPLIADGLVNPTRVRQWGQLVARLDAEHTPRSALGVSDGGILLYAWSLAASADQMGEAMRRAGARFAMHLDMNPGHTGLSFLAPGEPPAGPPRVLGAGAPEMDHRADRWSGVETRDFFYLVERSHMGSSVTATARPDEPEDLGTARLTEDEPAVRVWRFDRLTAALVPGVADTAQSTEPPRALRLPAPPRAWLEVGLRARDDAFGLIAGGATLVAPKVEAMTWWVDEVGVPRMGRWTRRPEPWPRDLVQGPVLVDAGRLVQALDVAVVATPIAPGEAAPESMVGLGLDAAGRMLVAVGPAGSPSALARALVDRGAVHALSTTQRSTPETGLLRKLALEGDRLVERTTPDGPGTPVDLRPRLGTVFAFYPRPPEVFARSTVTFKDAPTDTASP